MNTPKSYRIFLATLCLTLALAFTLATVNVNAGGMQQAGTDFAAIDAYITEQMNELGIPGIGLGIVQDGQIVYVKGFGVADSSGRPVTPQTPFRIGSITKSFTALAVMQLVEAGQVDLDAPIQTYLPWFELADKEASAQITVRHLLNNISGISRLDGERDLLSQQGLEEMVHGLDTVELTQPVGTNFQYSNLNWDIAGLIVEVVSGQSYEDYVSEHIFEPLDMRHSYASHPLALADGLAEEHHIMYGLAFQSERPVPPAHLPSGFLVVSVEDMAHYAVAQLNNGRYDNTSILSPQGIAELHSSAILAWEGLYYAMGWEVGTLSGIPIVSHTGDDGSNHSKILLMPERGMGIILLANASGFEQNPQINQVVENVVGLLDGETPAPVSAPFHYSFLYWSVLFMPLLMILGIAYIWRQWGKREAGRPLFIVLLFAGVALLLLFGVPLAIDQPLWTGMRFYHPELAYNLIASAFLGLGWSVIYTAMCLRARKA